MVAGRVSENPSEDSYPARGLPAPLLQQAHRVCRSDSTRSLFIEANAGSRLLGGTVETHHRHALAVGVIKGGSHCRQNGYQKCEGRSKAAFHESFSLSGRQAVGPGVEIFIDAHGRFELPTAVRLANRLEPYRIGWFEEPVPPENWDALRQFRDLTNVPVCVGERLYTRWQFRPVLEQKLAEYIMPDIIRTGGISEMKKIATMAEAFFVPISPHDATGPITLIAGAHTMLTTPNFFRLEIAYSELEVYQQVMQPPFDVRSGYFHVSDRPGLGHELRPDYIEKAIAF